MSEKPPKRPPHEFILDEMRARQWKRQTLADAMGVMWVVAADLVAGRRSITPEIANKLATAFGTSPEVWLKLERDAQ